MSDDRRARARLLRDEGWTYERIAAELGAGKGTVCRWVNPAADERSREASRAWKERNREADRARNRAYTARLDQRGRCMDCGGPMGVGKRHDGVCMACRHRVAEARADRLVALYEQGVRRSDIAVLMGTSLGSVQVELTTLRKAGRIGYRYAGWRDRAAA